MITVVIVLLAIGGVTWARGGVLFSSGPLNAQAGSVLGGVSSHAGLGGQCKSCHAALWSGDLMSDRCLSCHSEVSAELNDSTALHGILKDSYPEMNCRTCHTEHNGPDASLTFLTLTVFPHELVGFSLAAHSIPAEGKPIGCQDCHTEKLTVLDQGVCAACHLSFAPEIEEDHFAVFGVDCLACHDGIDTYGSAFEHASTGFVLIGAHLDTACQGCHSGATTLEMLAAAPERCFDCHEEDDAHNGRLGEDCTICHTSNRWQEIIFDHATTGYMLVGQHSTLECGACHVDQNFENTPGTCVGCHEADNPHDVLFGTDCVLCHNSVSWQDVQFDHTLIDTSDCQACHLENAPENHYPGQCSTCHTTSAWLPAFFDHESAGATDCQACHTRPAGHYPGQCSACHTTSGWLPAFFDHSAAGATDCQSCHNRPANHYNGQCSLCHSTSSWAFIHSSGTDCRACHTPPANHYSGQCSTCHSINSWAFIHSSGTDCQACHRRPSEHPGGQCSQCHTTSNWDDAEGNDEGDDD